MNLVLIDDHQLIRESLQQLIQKQDSSIEITLYADAAMFLADVQNHSLPDVLITDLLMPGINGIKLIEICNTLYKNSAMKIIVLSSVMDVQTIRQCFESGAHAFLSKDISFKELRYAISQVTDNKRYVGENMQNMFIEGILSEHKNPMPLSQREKEVLQKVCSGQTIREIASDLDLSIHTVQYYHRQVLAKLKVKRTPDLIVYAMQHGLYNPDVNQRP